MRALHLIRTINAARYRSLSKEQHPIARDCVDLMQIIRFLCDPNEEDMSRLGSIPQRQMTVVQAFPFTKDLIKSTVLPRLITLCGGMKEIAWSKKMPVPVVFFVEANENAGKLVEYAKDTEHTKDHILRNLRTIWQIDQNQEAIDVSIVNAYMQCVERCEVNTHILLLLVDAIQDSGGYVCLNKKKATLGRVFAYGYTKCLATIKANPLQIPYAPVGLTGQIMAQSVFANDGVNQGPGNLTNGKLPHVIMWLDLQFGSITQRYYVDSSFAQLVWSKNRFAVFSDDAIDKKIYEFKESHTFNKADSLDNITEQFGLYTTKFTPHKTKIFYERLLDVLRQADRKFLTNITTDVQNYVAKSRWKTVLQEGKM